MKKTSIITAAVAFVSSMTASTVFAAPITMTGALATQTLTWSGCKTLKTTDTVTVTFDDSSVPNTYSVVDSSSNIVLQGTWFKLPGKTATSPYTIYMAPSVFAPAPDDPNVVASPDPTIPPPAGTLDDFLDQIKVAAESAPPVGMNCKLNTTKPPLGTQSVTLYQPSALVKKSLATVKTNKDSTKFGTLTFQVGGSEASLFTGKPKFGKFSAKLVITGTVVE